MSEKIKATAFEITPELQRLFESHFGSILGLLGDFASIAEESRRQEFIRQTVRKVALDMFVSIYGQGMISVTHPGEVIRSTSMVKTHNANN